MNRSYNLLWIVLPSPTNKNIVTTSTYNLLAKRFSLGILSRVLRKKVSTDRTILYHCLRFTLSLFLHLVDFLSRHFSFLLDFILLDFLYGEGSNHCYSVTMDFLVESKMKLTVILSKLPKSLFSKATD